MWTSLCFWGCGKSFKLRDEIWFNLPNGCLRMDEAKSKTKGLEIVLNWKDLVFVIIVGVCIALALGFFENTPEVYLGHIKLYGYPLAWRVVWPDTPVEYIVLKLLVDFAFWIAVVFIVIALSEGVSRKLKW